MGVWKKVAVGGRGKPKKRRARPFGGPSLGVIQTFRRIRVDDVAYPLVLTTFLRPAPVSWRFSTVNPRSFRSMPTNERMEAATVAAKCAQLPDTALPLPLVAVLTFAVVAGERSTRAIPKVE